MSEDNKKSYTFTKEELICGTKQELIDYLYDTYKFVPRTPESEYKPNTNFDGINSELTIKEQLDKIEQSPNSFGMLSFLRVDDVDKNVAELIDGIPNIELSFGKIWVFIRGERAIPSHYRNLTIVMDEINDKGKILEKTTEFKIFMSDELYKDVRKDLADNMDKKYKIRLEPTE